MVFHFIFFQNPVVNSTHFTKENVKIRIIPPFFKEKMKAFIRTHIFIINV